MFRSREERKLETLFARRGDVGEAHREELLGELLTKFDRQYPKKEKMRMKSVFLRRALVLAATAVLLGTVACVAPADIDVEVGRSLEIEYKQSSGGPMPQDIVAHVEKSVDHVEDLAVRARMEGDKVVLTLDVWGSDLPDSGLADELRQAFPALSDAKIKEEHLQGKVAGTFGAKLGKDLFDLDVIDAKDVEEARKELMARLAAQGVQGKVDVEVKDDGAHRKVMIRVEQEDCEPSDDEEAEPQPREPMAPPQE